MKKKIIITVAKALKRVVTTGSFLATVTAVSWAQQQSQAPNKRTEWGIKAGLNVSSIGGNNYNNIKAKAGFHAGITIDYAFTDAIYLLTGLEYTIKGPIVELSPNDQHINADYVQLPLSVGYKLRMRDELILIIDAGPYLAYGVNGRITEGSYKQDTFSGVALKRFDCGMIVGTAVDFRQFRFGMHCDFGLINVMQKGNDKAQNWNLALSTGIRF